MKKTFKEKIGEKFIFSKIRIIIFVSLWIICTTFSAIYVWSESLIIKDNDFVCVFADVDHGDAIIMKLPDGKVMIIDSGDEEESSQIKFEKIVKNFMKDNDVIDYLVLTHADNDHCSGMKFLFDNYQVVNFYRPKQFVYGIDTYDKDSSREYNNGYSDVIKCSLEEEGLEIFYNESGIYFDGENYSVEFIAPLYEKYQNSNDYSAVILVNVYDKKFLFTGDISGDIEKDLVSYYGKYDIDVLKVAHHGSKNSTTKEFLENFTPEYAVISCGKNNSYGFPKRETIENLYSAGIHTDDIFITYNGNIIFSVNENGIKTFVKTNTDSPVWIIICIVIFESTILFVVVFTRFRIFDDY